MDFNIKCESLLKELQAVIGAIEKKQTLPILSNVLLEAEENNLKITATNLEIELSITTVLTHVLKTGTMTLPAKKLFDICKTLPLEMDIHIIHKNNFATLYCDKSEFILNTLPTTDFPTKSFLQEKETLQIKQETLYKLFKSTYFTMAQQDVRYYLNGLLIELNKNEVKVVATDGHRLSFCQKSNLDYDICSKKHQIIIPRKAVNELLRLLNVNSEEYLILEFNEEYLALNLMDIHFVSRLIDGKFPDYQRVIPYNNPHKLLVDKLILSQALKRALIFSNDQQKSVIFNLSENKLILSAENKQEKTTEEIEVEFPNVNLTIRFNISYINEVLDVISEPQVVFYLKDDLHGCLITGLEEMNCQYVVMPMRI